MIWEVCENMKGTQITFLIHGIINIFMHLPVFIATSFWGLLLIGIFNLDTLTDPFWSAVSMCPLLIPPVSCIVGIVRGGINFKKDIYARWCLILSIIGLFTYVGLIILCAWIGSRF